MVFKCLVYISIVIQFGIGRFGSNVLCDKNQTFLGQIHMFPHPDRKHTTDQSMNIIKVQFHLAMCLICVTYKYMSESYLQVKKRHRNSRIILRLPAQVGIQTARDSGKQVKSLEYVLSRCLTWSKLIQGSILVSFSPRQMVWFT